MIRNVYLIIAILGTIWPYAYFVPFVIEHGKAATTSPSSTSWDALLSPRNGIAFCWLGNLSWLIYAHGRLLATDLDLGRAGRIQPSLISTVDIALVLDLHLITYGHEDHFSTPTCTMLPERSNCTFRTHKLLERGTRDRHLSPSHPCRASGRVL